MKLVYDQNMPAVPELLGGQFELLAVNGRDLTRGQLADAMALLVRS